MMARTSDSFSETWGLRIYKFINMMEVDMIMSDQRLIYARLSGFMAFKHAPLNFGVYCISRGVAIDFGHGSRYTQGPEYPTLIYPG